MIKKMLFIFFLLITIGSFAQKIKLNYQPHGQIIKFNFNDLIIITDSNALFLISNYGPYIIDTVTYLQKIRYLINSANADDTIKFSKSFVPFKDSLRLKYEDYEKYWRVWLSIRNLTIENKVLITEENGNRINEIKLVTKKYKKTQGCFDAKVFVNAKTKKELFVYEYLNFCTGILFDY